MAGDRSGVGGTLARGVVAACFLGGAVLAVTGRLVVAGVAFLAGHTVLATAAVIQGQRSRGVGLSLSGVGWLVASIGLHARADSGSGAVAGLPETPLLVGGFGLVVVGTLLVTGGIGVAGE